MFLFTIKGKIYLMVCYFLHKKFISNKSFEIQNISSIWLIHVRKINRWKKLSWQYTEVDILPFAHRYLGKRFWKIEAFLGRQNTTKITTQGNIFLQKICNCSPMPWKINNSSLQVTNRKFYGIILGKDFESLGNNFKNPRKVIKILEIIFIHWAKISYLNINTSKIRINLVVEDYCRKSSRLENVLYITAGSTWNDL